MTQDGPSFWTSTDINLMRISGLGRETSRTANSYGTLLQYQIDRSTPVPILSARTSDREKNPAPGIGRLVPQDLHRPRLP